MPMLQVSPALIRRSGDQKYLPLICATGSNTGDARATSTCGVIALLHLSSETTPFQSGRNAPTQQKPGDDAAAQPYPFQQRQFFHRLLSQSNEATSRLYSCRATDNFRNRIHLAIPTDSPADFLAAWTGQSAFASASSQLNSNPILNLPIRSVAIVHHRVDQIVSRDHLHQQRRKFVWMHLAPGGGAQEFCGVHLLQNHAEAMRAVRLRQ
jgi:hypothetical protein